MAYYTACMRTLLALVTVGLLGCTSGHDNKFKSQQGDGGCSDSPLMGGSKGFGESCSNDFDCMTVCCVCGADAGAGSWLTRICQDGLCTGVEACSVTQEPGFCK